MEGFLFIQETGYKPQEKRTRSDIKMHVADRLVMQKRMRQSKRGEGKRNLRAAGSRDEEEENEDDGNDVVRIAKGRGQALQQQATTLGSTSTNAATMIGVTGINIHLDEQTRFFLHHFLHHTSQSLCTVTTETGWLTYALTNRTLFYATLYHWVLLNQDSIPATYKQPEKLLVFKGRVIAFINSEMHVGGGVGDEVLGSVACLASLLIGDFEEANMHFEGLKAMVSRRKGVGNSGFGGLIGRLVRWTDSCRAQISNSHLLLDQEQIRPEITSVNALSQSIIESQIESTIIQRLRALSQELTQCPRDLLPPERRVSLGEQFLTSDRELLTLIHGHTYAENPGLAIFALSALIYSECVLRGMKRGSRVIKTIVGLLKLRLLEFNGIWWNERLGWAVINGVLATQKGSEEGEWFLEYWAGNFGIVGEVLQKIARSQDVGNEDSPAAFSWILGDEVLDIGRYDKLVLLE
ncbi:hypothetical protein HYFRA_00001615 [Hymenoscyphus fraxineus]|uniref:Uncharacterized protein n=1 Tax=Hymenoscyphus fraxineus TaxID=746836 RepID=A0A9N9L5Y2_9HELO|nr:hypothetical protein HYFRA_00001615 [Hymenoscyphus fraxineus]